jgi:hypothetical protein
MLASDWEMADQTRYCLFAWHRNCIPELILEIYEHGIPGGVK